MAEFDLASYLLRIITAHDWGWSEGAYGEVTGLVCNCGWATPTTRDGAVDQWKRHRDRAVRAALAELITQPPGGSQP